VCGGGNIFGGGGRLGWPASLTFGGGGLGGGGGDFGIGLNGGNIGWIIRLFFGDGGGGVRRRCNEALTMQLVCDSIIPWKMMNANK
jgi:hypothetical protein